MFKPIQFFTNLIVAFRENQELRDEIEFLEEQIEQLTEQNIDLTTKLKSPLYHLDQVFEEGLEWYDVEELLPEDRKSYSSYAEQLLKNPVFKNETNFLITNLTKKSILDSIEFKDVERKRESILLLADFKTRVEELIIEEPKVDKFAEDDIEQYDAT